MSTMRTIAAADGMKGFFRGLVPGLHRQLGFCTIRLGLYDTTKDFYMKVSISTAYILSEIVTLQTFYTLSTRYVNVIMMTQKTRAKRN